MAGPKRFVDNQRRLGGPTGCCYLRTSSREKIVMARPKRFVSNQKAPRRACWLLLLD